MALRNGIALGGALLLGWPARTLLVLYFADTLAGCWAALAGVTAWMVGADRLEGFWGGLHSLVSAMLGALVIVPFLAVPLGIPLVLALDPSMATWRGLWSDPGFVLALAVIALTAAVTAVRHLLALAAGQAGQDGVKQAFAILFTRWVLVLMASFWVGALGVPGAYVLVAVYAIATAWSEVRPESFARLIPERSPAGPPTTSPPRARRGRAG